MMRWFVMWLANLAKVEIVDLGLKLDDSFCIFNPILFYMG